MSKTESRKVSSETKVTTSCYDKKRNNNIWQHLFYCNQPDLNLTGPCGVRKIGLSSVQSSESSLSSVSLISASSLLSVVNILPSLLVIVWIKLSFSESDSPCTLLWRLKESENLSETIILTVIVFYCYDIRQTKN